MPRGIIEGSPRPWELGERDGAAEGPEVDPAVRPLLGRWWSEGSEFVFSWSDGALSAAVAGAAHRPPAVFAADGHDQWRVVSGREAGELLRVVRDDGGAVTRLHWATYAFTREARVFGATGGSSAPYDG